MHNVATSVILRLFMFQSSACPQSTGLMIKVTGVCIAGFRRYDSCRPLKRHIITDMRAYQVQSLGLLAAA